jgi:hypothetical protein
MLLESLSDENRILPLAGGQDKYKNKKDINDVTICLIIF